MSADLPRRAVLVPTTLLTLLVGGALAASAPPRPVDLAPLAVAAVAAVGVAVALRASARGRRVPPALVIAVAAAPWLAGALAATVIAAGAIDDGADVLRRAARPRLLGAQASVALLAGAAWILAACATARRAPVLRAEVAAAVPLAVAGALAAQGVAMESLAVARDLTTELGRAALGWLWIVPGVGAALWLAMDRVLPTAARLLAVAASVAPVVIAQIVDARVATAALSRIAEAVP